MTRTFPKGNHSWNYGKTKETDIRISKSAESIKLGYKLATRKKYPAKLSNHWETRCCKWCNKTFEVIKSSHKHFCCFDCKNKSIHKTSWNSGKTKENDSRVRKTSEKIKQYWQKIPCDQKVGFMEKTAWSNVGNRPTKPEIELRELLDNIVPGYYSYVGDGKFWVTSCGKHMNPDFVSVENRKIIELNGVYWHKDKDDNNRINLFNLIGYEVLIITDEDLRKNTDTVVNNIKDFSLRS